MNRIVFLVEEQSMKILLDGLLPRLIPEISFLCIPHEGKQDLEKSIPRKLRGWREPGARFVIIRDNDGCDCELLKQKLTDICGEAGRDDVLVRIACQELEAWYFGEPAALAAAFDDNNLSTIERKAKYRNPDAIIQPANKLMKLIPEFQKLSGARRMAHHLTAEGNHSKSFQVTLEGIRRLSQS